VRPPGTKRTAEDFGKLLDRAKLTQASAARALKLAPRTVRGYALGEFAPPYPVVLALKYLAEHPNEVKP